MRDYLYLWPDRNTQSIVVSGVEFRDLLPVLASAAGIVLLTHDYDNAGYHPDSGLDFVPRHDLEALARRDIYSWGDFVWADYLQLESLDDQETARLLFFAHRGRPLDSIEIASLTNSYLAFAHDDGWLLRVFGSSWDKCDSLACYLLSVALPPHDVRAMVAALDEGQALWVRGGNAKTCSGTADMDGILAANL